jgi:hypothetical protein
VGKSALLQHLVFGLPQGEEGVVHAKVRRRGVYDIQAQLFKAFWECEVRFTPAPEEMSDFLGERRALVVLDDVGLDRSDLEELIDSSPGCTFVIGSEEQTLWSGSAQRLAGLDTEAALELIELRLERPLAADERAPAAAVAQALEGHPQPLVEAAAGVRAGSTSFEELAGGPTWDLVGEASNAEALNEAQHRILAVLRAADAPLGTDRIAEFADVPGAARELAALESDGWVRSASPRYRLAREVTLGDRELSREELLRRLGEWAQRRATPEEVADEAEVIERALEREADPPSKVALARAAEGKLALAGMLDSWGRVLNAALRASRDPHDEAYMLHQLGTRHGLIGQDKPAIDYLERALELREGVRDQEGVEVTRHNLQQLRGGTNGFDRDGGNGGGPGWPRPKLGLLLAVVAAMVGGAGIYAVANDGDPASDVAPPKPPKTGPPAVRVEKPTHGARYSEGETVLAAYACAAARDAQLRSCRGEVPRDTAINTKKGRHVFRVTASDSDGRQKVVKIRYSVSGSPAPRAEDDETKPTSRATKSRQNGGEEPHRNPRGPRPRDKPPARKTIPERPPDTTPPTISITTPDGRDGANTYTQYDPVLADYSCKDAGGSGIERCEASVDGDPPIEDGAMVDTATIRPHTFKVTAEDKAGNMAEPVVVTYYVAQASG